MSLELPFTVAEGPSPWEWRQTPYGGAMSRLVEIEWRLLEQLVRLAAELPPDDPLRWEIEGNARALERSIRKVRVWRAS